LKDGRKESDLQRAAESSSGMGNILSMNQTIARNGWNHVLALTPGGRRSGFSSCFAYGLLSLPEAEFERLRQNLGKQDRKSIIYDLKKCIESCMHLCRRSLNHMVLHLLHKNLLLETVLNGDFSEFNVETS